MKKQQIIAKVKGQTINTIVDFLGDEFTAAQLVQALKNEKDQSNQDILTPQELNEIAEKYDESGNEEEAFVIYQYAAKLGASKAAGVVAVYYFRGILPCVKDLKEAAAFCAKAIAGGCDDRNTLMAKIKHEVIEKIKGQTIDTIVDFLGNEFTAEQLVQALKNEKDQSNQDILTPQELNEIAEQYDESGNEEDAFVIYEYAAELDEPVAAGNVAVYYFKGLSPCAKDLKEAKDFCEKAIAGGCDDRNILMAKIHTENKEYLEAMKCLALITEDPLHNNIQIEAEARLLEKEIMMEKLESLYERANNPVMHVAGVLGATHLTNNSKFGWQDIKDDSEIDALDEKTYNEMLAKVQILEGQAKQDKSLIGKLANATKALESYSNMSKVLIRRQIQIENHFFDPGRTKNSRALRLAKALEERRLNEIELQQLAINDQGADALAGPARQFITAERSTVQTSVEISPHTDGCNPFGYKHKIGWKHSLAHNPPIAGKRADSDFTHYETLNFSGTTIKYCQKINSHKNHLGDYSLYLEGHANSDYNEIIKIIDNITQKDSAAERKMAKLMLKFVHDGHAVNLASLQAIKQGATQQDVNDLNRIFYHCFIKEVARWMLPTEGSHNLPLAIAQGRALQLIVKGFLRMQDVFSKNAQYGVYTGGNIGADLASLKQKIIAINDKYQVHVLQALPSYKNFIQSNPNGKVVSSRKGLRVELQKTFGGESDTDGDGYESDNQRENLHKTVMDM